MRQFFWYALQIGVFAAVVHWFFSNGKTDGGVFVVALMFTAAATAAVMIARDSFLWVARRLASFRQRDNASEGRRLAAPRPRLSEPGKFSPRRWIGK